MLENITLSINPIYQCNFRCDFCYLRPEQLSDPKTLSLNKLEARLKEISSHRRISFIDLYGGEIALLKNDYLNEMHAIVRNFYRGPINVITNLSMNIPYFDKEDVTLSVSWDYDGRAQYDKVLSHIMGMSKDVHILMLASPQMLKWDVQKVTDVVSLFNLAKNIKSVEIKPYSANQSNQYNITYNAFEEFIKLWLSLKETFQFQFINEQLILDSLKGVKNSWSDDHLYITPNGKLAVLDFDTNYNEQFIELNNFEQYTQWHKKEKIKITQNKECSSCSYMGHCLSEHLKNHSNHKNSCDGFKGLLDWYKEEDHYGTSE